ncbi:nitroreductase [Aurantivibrio plasticivorans]
MNHLEFQLPSSSPVDEIYPLVDDDPKMSLLDAIYSRRSVRGFLDKKIPQNELERILQIAQHAPSNCNIQPWQVFIATGETKDRLSRTMIENLKAGIDQNQDYEYSGNFVDQYRRRQVDCAVALYNQMGIERGDKEGRIRGVMRNYEYFDAPYMAFIGMDEKFSAPVALDIGMYAQTFMLTLRAFGLHSCAMGSMRSYPDLVREAFGVSSQTRILFGIAFGYEDESVAANRTRVYRDPIEANVLIKD